MIIERYNYGTSLTPVCHNSILYTFQSALPVLDYYVLFNLLVTLLYLICMTTVRIF